MTKNSNFVSIRAKSPYFSVIIPVRKPTRYLKENLSKLKRIFDKSFEVIVVTDNISKSANPAFKRNLGAKKAKGKVLVFFDDDSYPDPSYFQEARKIFESETNVACGPQLTPGSDNQLQQASGILLESALASGGAGTFRNQIKSKRFVDDYPSVNFCITKKLFQKLGGFDVAHWPGEDTLLCRKIIKNKYKILYTPKLVVYHHRRPVGLSFLMQHMRYGQHRGHFSRIYPENSAKIGYFIPSLFTLYLPVSLFFPYPLYLYLALMFLQFLFFLFKKKTVLAPLLATLFTPLLHLTYGTAFIVGFIKSNLDFIPHKIDSTGNYTGG